MKILASKIRGLVVNCFDGPIGKVCDYYVSENHWQITHLSVNTPLSMSEYCHLVPVSKLRSFDFNQNRINLDILVHHVNKGPRVTRNELVAPDRVSRHWDEYYKRQRSTKVPSFVGPMGPTWDKSSRAINERPSLSFPLNRLNSLRVSALDGHLGRVVDGIVDCEHLKLESLVMKSRNYLVFAKKKILQAGCIHQIDWASREIHCEVSRHTDLEDFHGRDISSHLGQDVVVDYEGHMKIDPKVKSVAPHH